MKKIYIITVLTLVSIIGTSQTKVDSKFGKGIFNIEAADSSWSMKMGMRFQSLFIGDWVINDTSGLQSADAQFLIRRARLKFGGYVVSPKIKYKIELGLSNKDLGKASPYTNQASKMILDAVIKWNFYKGFTLWAGQTKLPGNRERIISSGNMQFVDRSILNKTFNLDRDMGVQLHHKHTIGKQFIIKEAYSFTPGEGRNFIGDNIGGFKHTVKIEFLPLGKFTSKGAYSGGDLKREEKPKLAIAAVYDYHDRAVKTKGNGGHFMSNDAGYFETNVQTLFVDAIFKYKGVSIMGEFASRTADQTKAINTDGTATGDIVEVGTGLNTSIGYLFKNNWEIAGRYANVTWDKNTTGKSAKTQYALGLSKYVVGHKLKIQSDVSYTEVNGSSNKGLMYRLQFDLHF